MKTCGICVTSEPSSFRHVFVHVDKSSYWSIIDALLNFQFWLNYHFKRFETLQKRHVCLTLRVIRFVLERYYTCSISHQWMCVLALPSSQSTVWPRLRLNAVLAFESIRAFTTNHTNVSQRMKTIKIWNGIRIKDYQIKQLFVYWIGLINGLLFFLFKVCPFPVPSLNLHSRKTYFWLLCEFNIPSFLIFIEICLRNSVNVIFG